MAAMSGWPVGEAFGNMEQSAQDQRPPDASSSDVDANSPATSPTSDPNHTNDDRSHHPHQHHHHVEKAYSRAYFNPHILVVFLLAVIVPTLYIYLYVGGFWNPSAHLGNVSIHLINLDEGVNRAQLISSQGLNSTGVAVLALLLPSDNLGLFLSTTLLTNPSSAHIFHWHYFDASNTSLPSVAAAIDSVTLGDEDQWFTIVIPPAYTTTYIASAINVYNLSQLNGDIYAETIAGQLPSPLNGSYINPIYEVWDQGRSYAANSFISAALTACFNGLSSAITAEVYSRTATLAFGTSYFKAAFFLQPIPITSIDTHPVPYYGMNFFSYLCGLVLWIGSIITLTVVIKWSQGVETKFIGRAETQWDERVSAGFALTVRVIMLGGIAMIQAACVMSVLPALGGSDAIEYGKGALFVWLWYCAFVFVSVLGGLVALVGPEVFQLPATLWLILQLTSSGAIMDQDLQPSFYKVGRAFPLYYCVRGARTILFGSYYHIKQDALILFGWLIGSLLIVAVFGTRRVEGRWKTMRESAIVHAIRDTVGFSSVPPPAQTVPLLKVEQGKRVGGEEEKEREEGVGQAKAAMQRSSTVPLQPVVRSTPPLKTAGSVPEAT